MEKNEQNILGDMASKENSKAPGAGLTTWGWGP